MPSFKANVRFVDLEGPDDRAVRRALEERLRATEIGRWHITEISERRPAKPARRRLPADWQRHGDIAGKLILMGALVWALWFFWVLTE